LVNFLRSPSDALTVLGHLQSGNGDTAAVGCLSRSVPYTCC
jgi:hypothetical protein